MEGYDEPPAMTMELPAQLPGLMSRTKLGEVFTLFLFRNERIRHRKWCKVTARRKRGEGERAARACFPSNGRASHGGAFVVECRVGKLRDWQRKTVEKKRGKEECLDKVVFLKMGVTKNITNRRYTSKGEE